MSYGYSSAHPRVPNSTPQLPSSIRPPIHNPYDKFTQPQFDEWIGGITSALRKALGQEEETSTSQATKSCNEDAYPVTDIGEDNAEDPFAEWTAMRAKEKDKMRATEGRQDSEYGGSQESYEGSDAQDHAAGNTPSDAIELLSDEDDAEGGEFNDPGAYGNEGHDGGLAESSSSMESDGEVQQPLVGSSQPLAPLKLHAFANAAGQEAIEISDGETVDNDQGKDFPDAENVLFGWGPEEEGEDQQPPDIRDPWELPETYAEDLYTGGPIREADRSRLSPSHLTPAAEDADFFDNIGPQLRPSSVLFQPTDHNLAEVSQGSATPTLIPSATDEASNGDDELSLYDEDVLELDTPTAAAPRGETDFISFTALNQPSDMDSERGGPEILCISDNDGGEASADDEEAEEDEFDGNGPVPLGTSDLEIPAEHELEEDGGEELDELEDDDEPAPEASTNPPYGYYGLDASSVTGSGGLDDEARTVGPPSDPPKGDHSGALDAAISQEFTSTFDPHDLVSLPAATTFVEIGHQLQSAVSIGDTTKTSLAEVSFASLDGTPTVSDEVVAGKEDADSVGENTVGDDIVSFNEAVLTMNEVEEVLRDVFAEADQLASTANDQDVASVSGITPFIEERVASISPKPDPSGQTPEAFAGEEPLPHEPAIKEDGHDPVESPPSTVKDKNLSSQEEQKKPTPFIMPLVANPNVRDPMSAPWSPIQSGPPTPVAGLAYLPAVTKFKRDNQLLGTAHTGSGLFTPLEGSGSSSPSPSDTTTPEVQSGANVETEAPAAEDNEQHLGEQAISILTSSITTSPGNAEVEPEVVPADPSEDDSWGDIPRLPTPPTEIMDYSEGDLLNGPVTRVFFQPDESNDMGGFDTRSEADHDNDTKDGDALPALAADTPSEEDGDAPGLSGAKSLVHTADDTTDLPEVTEVDDPFKLMGNNSTVALGAVVNDDDGSSIASSSPDEEQTPRLKVFEIPAPVTRDLQAAESMHPEIRPPSQSLIQAQESVATPTETQKNVRKRKRSESIPVNPEPSGSGSTANGSASDVVSTSVGNAEYEKVGYEFIDNEPRDHGGEHDSDNESFISSLAVPRNNDPSSHASSRASSVVSERPLLLQGHNPVPDDAPVFHGHGKFKAALQALKFLRRTPEQNERETQQVKERGLEKERPIVVRMGPRKPSEDGSNANTGTKKPPSLVLPEVSTQPSLPSASTSQSPRTPASTLPPSSPTVITASTEVIPPPRQEQTAQEPAEPDQEVTQKPVKAVKRTASKKHIPVEPRSTRSRCRYHKISLPREENGPRVTFCVPQCSLNDKELMEKEDITDDGQATVRDFERLWDRVEEQKLSPYLIGIIRQLVGLDLLRENEVYYLPTDEEVKRMERQKKEERRKSRKSMGSAVNMGGSSVVGRSDSVSTAGPTSQSSRNQMEKGKPGPPPSFAGSISTTTSMRSKVGRRGSTRSISEDEVSDGERGGRASKRRRVGREWDGARSSRRNTPSVHEDSAAPSTAGSPAPSQPTTERTSVRRSQRTLKKAISVDAQAYKPSVSSGGESSEDEVENAKMRRKSARGGVKGLKRRRTEGTSDPSIPSAAGGVGDRGTPLSPVSTRPKRAKIDEK